MPLAKFVAFLLLVGICVLAVLEPAVAFPNRGIISSPAALRPHDVLMPPPAVPSPRLKGKSPRMPATVASSPSLAPTDGSPLPPLSLDRFTAHRVSDQRRRDELRICFDALVQVLPPSSTTLTGSISSSLSSSSTAFEEDDEDDDDDPGRQAGAGAEMGKGTAGSKASSRGPNRVSILSRTVDYIQTLKTRTSALDERMEQLTMDARSSAFF
ncbi:hypothetical protein DFJ73DRAFT_802170 [Zopfochytrium polystomum]|nr:hypothetical protein DFJ73DRAFT_802170 [Zopfochytrium polystomum]